MADLGAATTGTALPGYYAAPVQVQRRHRTTEVERAPRDAAALGFAGFWRTEQRTSITQPATGPRVASRQPFTGDVKALLAERRHRLTEVERGDRDVARPTPALAVDRFYRTEQRTSLAQPAVPPGSFGNVRQPFVADVKALRAERRHRLTEVERADRDSAFPRISGADSASRMAVFAAGAQAAPGGRVDARQPFTAAHPSTMRWQRRNRLVQPDTTEPVAFRPKLYRPGGDPGVTYTWQEVRADLSLATLTLAGVWNGTTIVSATVDKVTT